jgi:hypothetical protein
MLTLRPTKMLAQRLKIEVPAAPPPVENRVADWCVHEFREGRQRYLMFCNTATLLPLMTHATGVRSDHDLITRLRDGFQNVLVGTELEFAYQRWIVPELGTVQWAPIPGKAVLSSLNELIMMSRYGMDKSPVEMSEWLAKVPMKAIGHESPGRAFRQLRGPDRAASS